MVLCPQPTRLVQSIPKFSLCLPFIGCIKSQYPWVSKRQYGAGAIWDDASTGW